MSEKNFWETRNIENQFERNIKNY